VALRFRRLPQGADSVGFLPQSRRPTALRKPLARCRSSVASAQANLTKAREQLGYAQLNSDFAGVVTAVGAQVGQVVSPGQKVVTVAFFNPDFLQ